MVARRLHFYTLDLKYNRLYHHFHNNHICRLASSYLSSLVIPFNYRQLLSNSWLIFNILPCLA